MCTRKRSTKVPAIGPIEVSYLSDQRIGSDIDVRRQIRYLVAHLDQTLIGESLARLMKNHFIGVHAPCYSTRFFGAVIGC